MAGNKKHNNFYHRSGQNPAISKAELKASINKELLKAQENGIEYAIIVMKIFTYCVLGDKFGFSISDIERMAKEYENHGELITGNYESVEDVLKVVQNEYKTKFTMEELTKIDPDLRSTEM